MNDKEYMSLAISLAEKGLGWTNPNPMVGAVIVKNGRIIGQGWHERYGEFHAERNALQNCTEAPDGGTMYVTLEPCCHQGHQPPCTDAILEAGIARVVTGSDDPNPLVAGKGIQILREHGLQVETGLMKSECDRLNYVFFHFIQTGLPYVVIKYAMTMDGKIATYTGASQWITGEEARKQVHRDRHRYAAIMAGIGTVLADDPLLTCRVPQGHNPLRIICDSHLRIPLDSNIVKTAGDVPTIIASIQAGESKKATLEAAGCRVLTLSAEDGHISLPALIKKMGQEGIDSILLEGGGTLNWSALQSGIVQRVQTYIAPKLFGGPGKTPVEGAGVALPSQAIRLKNTTITRLGEDILMESEVEQNVHRDC